MRNLKNEYFKVLKPDSKKHDTGIQPTQKMANETKSMTQEEKQDLYGLIWSYIQMRGPHNKPEEISDFIWSEYKIMTKGIRMR